MEREWRDGSVVESKNFFKYTPVKGAISHREPSLLSTIALFRLMIKAWKPCSLKSLDMLKLLIIIILHRVVLRT